MPAYLSDAWIAALDEAARSHRRLADAAAGVHLVLEQVVLPTAADTADDPGDAAAGGDDTADEGGIRWHVVVNDGSVRFVPGPAVDPTVRFTTDADTARAITDGRLSATEAFMAGRLRVGGDTTALVHHHSLLDGLGDVFAAVDPD